MTAELWGKNRSYLAQFALALGGFAMGTSDLVTAGLLPEIARATHVDIPQAGNYIANYALGVFVGAPLLALLTAKFSRKKLLLSLLLFHAFINLLCSWAQNYHFLAYARFFAGLPHGIYFGIACVIAAAMVEEARRPRAVANVVLGMTMASLVGVPLAIALGQNFSWQAGYIFVTILGVTALILLCYIIPSQLNIHTTTLFGELKILKKSAVLLLLAFIAIESAGLPSILSYLKLILMEEAKFPLETIPLIMPLVGCGMLCANLIGPKITHYFGPYRSLLFIMLASLIVYLSFYFFCHNQMAMVINCFLLGVSFAAFPAIQTRMLAVAKEGQTFGSALIQSAFYAANALGAGGGGLLLKADFGYRDLPLLATCFSVAGFFIFLCFCRAAKREDLR